MLQNKGIMALPPKKMREVVFQLLYSHDTGRSEEQSSVSLLMKELQMARSSIYQAMDKASCIHQSLQEIDATITETVHSYAFDRIQSVERNILRLAIFELMIDKTVPPKVAIAEAMRLARKFSTPESANFVNAILDNIYKGILGEAPELETIEKSAREIEVLEQLVRQRAIDLISSNDPAQRNTDADTGIEGIASAMSEELGAVDGVFRLTESRSKLKH